MIVDAAVTTCVDGGRIRFGIHFNTGFSVVCFTPKFGRIRPRFDLLATICEVVDEAVRFSDAFTVDR